MADSSDSLVCYTIGYNFVTSSNQYFPCGGSGDDGSSSGGAQSCCFAGDYCMENSICHYTHPVTNGTGYYMAACTDPTWQDPACPKQCTSEYGADIIYDTTNQQWNCCFSREGFLNCQQPSDFIVQAPAPDEIQTLTQLNTPVPSPSTTAIGPISSNLGSTSTMSDALESSSIPSSSSLTSATSSSQNTAASAAATSSASPSPSASASGGSGLSGGAIAGIVIGCIAFLTLLALAALFLYRWNKRNTAAIREHEWKGNAPNASEMGGQHSVYAHVADKPAYGGAEQGPPGGVGYGHGSTPPVHELSGPEKEAQRMEPQELMASPGRAPAELGDGRKSALSR